ncbi:hypothetical protein ADM96_15640 [Burkholderia sp. ST111]|nr:hypothetical protein ADM96_15640 [Burkholderia sp. ST111]
MNTLDGVVAEVKNLCERAGAKLQANPHDPETLREMVEVMDAVKAVLFTAAETASLEGCKLLAAMHQNVEDLQAQVVCHLHEVEIDLKAKAILALGTKTLH